MQISDENVKHFLLDVINKAPIPGQYAEFVAQVKHEIANAVISNTASDLMVTRTKETNP